MSETSNKTRLEHDCIGQMEVPANVYWGIHTQRAIGNFPVSGITDSQHPELIRAYATVKRACAIANEELGLIDPAKAEAIRAACLEIEAGKLADQFPVDVMQGGAGTSSNMNMNEVIANRPPARRLHIHPSERRRQQVAVHERHLPGRLQTRAYRRDRAARRVHQETRQGLPRSGRQTYQ